MKLVVDKVYLLKNSKGTKVASALYKGFSDGEHSFFLGPRWTVFISIPDKDLNRFLVDEKDIVYMSPIY